VEQVIRDYKIETKNIYNMDKTGFSIGSMQAGYVVVDDTVQITITVSSTAGVGDDIGMYLR
jgi:hypothetical protein